MGLSFVIGSCELLCVSLCVGCNQCTMNPCSVKPLRWPVTMLPDERLERKKELESFIPNKKQAQHFRDIPSSYSLTYIHATKYSLATSGIALRSF